MALRALLLFAFLPAASSAREGVEGLYERVAPAVVGVECSLSREQGELAFGTGVIIAPEGLILTSITVVPPEAREIRVFLNGARILEAERVRSTPEKELVLLKLRPTGDAGRRYPYLHLGDSDRLKVGQLAYTLGNAFRSITEDDQVTLAAGAISGRYVLTEGRNQSHYLGPAIETSAAVNDGMDGGPLVDGRGEVVGLLSLNFSKNRWLGTAVPINSLKPLLAEELWWFSDAIDGGRVVLGIEVLRGDLAASRSDGSAALPPAPAPAAASPTIVRVEPDSPAARAGLRQGDVLTRWNGEPLRGATELRERFRAAKPGQRVEVEVERSGHAERISLVLWGRY